MRTRILFALVLLPLAAAAVAACGGSPDDGVVVPTGYGGGAVAPPYDYDAGYPGYDAGNTGDDAATAADGDGSAGPPIPPIAAIPSTPAAACPDGNAPTPYVLAQDGTLFTLDLATLTMKSLGVVACPETSSPMSLTVSPGGTAYVLYERGAVYAVDLRTLACTLTSVPETPPAYAGGWSAASSIALGAGRASDRLYVYAPQPSPTLRVADLGQHLFTAGGFAGSDSATPTAVTVDAHGRVFAVGTDGTIDQLDPATGAIVGRDATGLDGTSELQYALALMAWGDDLYAFVGTSGALTRYDLAGKTLQPMGQVNQTILGAAAAACAATPAAPPPDAGAPDAAPSGPGDDGGAIDGGAAPADDGSAAAEALPFAPGDAWVGSFACAPGVTNVALLVDSVDGATVHARIDFDWGASGRSASYALDGTYDPATREARFTPGPWAFGSSSTWTAVGLDGYVDLAGARLAGDVTHDGCGAFSLQR
jgi:hypothetical protein